MNRKANRPHLYSFCCAAICLAAFAATARAQAPTTQRQFAPGVVTTIPPAPEAEEMFSGPLPLVEIPVVTEGLDYEPQLASKSTTVLERSKTVTLRRTVWNLEFSFKPMRMLQVDVPQPSGQMQRKLVWYMVYQVRNPGGHMLPKEVVERVRPLGDEDGPVLRTHVTYVPEKTNEVEQFGRKTEELRFFPHFVLRATEYDKEYLDRVIPAAIEPIKAREFPGRQDMTLHDSISISQVSLPVSSDPNDGAWGVATWVDVEPRIDYFVIYVQGLTNAYKFEDPDGAFQKGDAPGTGRKIVRKTLQLNFWRPGDTINPHEREIRFGARIDPDPATQREVLKQYGIDKPIDHVWVYR